MVQFYISFYQFQTTATIIFIIHFVLSALINLLINCNMSQTYKDQSVKKSKQNQSEHKVSQKQLIQQSENRPSLKASSKRSQVQWQGVYLNGQFYLADRQSLQKLKAIEDQIQKQRAKLETLEVRNPDSSFYSLQGENQRIKSEASQDYATELNDSYFIQKKQKAQNALLEEQQKYKTKNFKTIEQKRQQLKKNMLPQVKQDENQQNNLSQASQKNKQSERKSHKQAKTPSQSKSKATSKVQKSKISEDNKNISQKSKSYQFVIQNASERNQQHENTQQNRQVSNKQQINDNQSQSQKISLQENPPSQVEKSNVSKRQSIRQLSVKQSKKSHQQQNNDKSSHKGSAKKSIQNLQEGEIAFKQPSQKKSILLSKSSKEKSNYEASIRENSEKPKIQDQQVSESLIKNQLISEKNSKHEKLENQSEKKSRISKKSQSSFSKAKQANQTPDGQVSVKKSIYSRRSSLKKNSQAENGLPDQDIKHTQQKSQKQFLKQQGQQISLKSNRIYSRKSSSKKSHPASQPNYESIAEKQQKQLSVKNDNQRSQKNQGSIKKISERQKSVGKVSRKSSVKNRIVQENIKKIQQLSKESINEYDSLEVLGNEKLESQSFVSKKSQSNKAAIDNYQQEKSKKSSYKQPSQHNSQAPSQHPESDKISKKSSIKKQAIIKNEQILSQRQRQTEKIQKISQRSVSNKKENQSQKSQKKSQKYSEVQKDQKSQKQYSEHKSSKRQVSLQEQFSDKVSQSFKQSALPVKQQSESSSYKKPTQLLTFQTKKQFDNRSVQWSEQRTEIGTRINDNKKQQEVSPTFKKNTNKVYEVQQPSQKKSVQNISQFSYKKSIKQTVEAKEVSQKKSHIQNQQNDRESNKSKELSQASRKAPSHRSKSKSVNKSTTNKNILQNLAEGEQQKSIIHYKKSQKGGIQKSAKNQQIQKVASIKSEQVDKAKSIKNIQTDSKSVKRQQVTKSKSVKNQQIVPSKSVKKEHIDIDKSIRQQSIKSKNTKEAEKEHIDKSIKQQSIKSKNAKEADKEHIDKSIRQQSIKSKNSKEAEKEKIMKKYQEKVSNDNQTIKQLQNQIKILQQQLKKIQERQDNIEKSQSPSKIILQKSSVLPDIASNHVQAKVQRKKLGLSSSILQYNALEQKKKKSKNQLQKEEKQNLKKEIANLKNIIRDMQLEKIRSIDYDKNTINSGKNQREDTFLEPLGTDSQIIDKNKQSLCSNQIGSTQQLQWNSEVLKLSKRSPDNAGRIVRINSKKQSEKGQSERPSSPHQKPYQFRLLGNLNRKESQKSQPVIRKELLQDQQQYNVIPLKKKGESVSPRKNINKSYQTKEELFKRLEKTQQGFHKFMEISKTFNDNQSNPQFSSVTPYKQQILHSELRNTQPMNNGQLYEQRKPTFGAVQSTQFIKQNMQKANNQEIQPNPPQDVAFQDWIMPNIPNTPNQWMSQQQLFEIAKKSFLVFGKNIGNDFHQLCMKKYKNCVMFVYGQDNDIVLWHYSGKFYYGGWKNNEPGEGQKYGQGIQYIPGKYAFKGQFLNGKKHGNGSMKYQNGNIYQGQWVNGNKHGRGQFFQAQSGATYMGEWKENKKDGYGVLKISDKQYYSGTFVKSMKYGYGVQRFANGDYYKGQYKNGRFHGKGKYVWSNRSSYQGDFVDGSRNGNGKWESSKQDGDLYIGEYYLDKKNGYGRYVWSNGCFYQGYFQNDLKHGKGRICYSDGKEVKGIWQSGVLTETEYEHKEIAHEQQPLKKSQKYSPQKPKYNKSNLHAF